MQLNKMSNVLSESDESKDNQVNDARVGSAFFVYIARMNNNTLYIGQTNNLERRSIEHQCHKHGAKYIRDNSRMFEIVYYETFTSRLDAMHRESQLKGWTRAKKQALIEQNIVKLRQLAKRKK